MIRDTTVFCNRPAEDQGKGVQDQVFLYREKTNEFSHAHVSPLSTGHDTHMLAVILPIHFLNYVFNGFLGKRGHLKHLQM